jgi:hypothetical protein
MAHNKTLTELKWFKWALWGPIASATLFAVIIAIWDNSQQTLSWGLSSAHINDAISRLKFPLAIASLAVPLVTLVATYHRSVQTAVQIAATESKNSFENNIKHREIFKEFLKKEEVRLGITFYDSDKLYENIFSQNDYRRFEYYADNMKRDVFYESCVDGFDKVAKNSCFVMPLIGELTFYLQWFRNNRDLPVESYKSLVLLLEVLDEFDLLFSVSNSKILSEKIKNEGAEAFENYHPEMVYPYIKKVFEFLGNSFVELIRLSYSADFREDDEFTNHFLAFQHELTEARAELKEVSKQYLER